MPLYAFAKSVANINIKLNSKFILKMLIETN